VDLPGRLVWGESSTTFRHVGGPGRGPEPAGSNRARLNKVWALLYLWVALELGAQLGRRFFRDDEDALQWSQGLASLLVAMGLGSAVLSALGMLTGPVVRALSLPWLVTLCQPQLPRLWRALRQEWGPGFAWPGLMMWVGVVVACLAPNTHHDALMYHYPLAEQYLEQGRLHWTETGVYDSVFHGFHLVYAWNLGIDGEAAANLTGSLSILILALASGHLAQTYSGAAAFLVLSSPVALLQGLGGLLDLPVAAFAMLALARLGKRGGCFWTWACASIKITALLPVLALGLAVWCRPRLACGVWLAGAIGAFPWLVNTYVHTGHPLHPLNFWPSQVLFQPTRFTWLGAALLLVAGIGFCRLTEPLRWGTLVLLSWLGRWWVGSDPRAWQMAWNPLVAWGSLLARRSDREPQSIGMALGLATRVGEGRYLLGLDCWLVPTAARACAVGGIGVKVVQALMAAICLLALAPRWSVGLGLSPTAPFLEERYPEVRVYHWLKTQNYHRVCLVECLPHHCPIAWVTAMPAGSDDWARLWGQMRGCDLILFNLNRGRTRRGLIRGYQRLLGQGIALEQQWIAELKTGALDLEVPGWQRAEKPIDASRSETIKNAEHLYMRSYGGRIVFQQGGIVGVTWSN